MMKTKKLIEELNTAGFNSYKYCPMCGRPLNEEVE